MPADSWIERRLGSKKDVAATITFRTAIALTAVTCSLTDESEAAAGTPPVTGATGGFVNQLGTIVANTVWYVSYADFAPSTLALVEGKRYILKFFAVRSDGDVETPEVGIVVSF